MLIAAIAHRVHRPGELGDAYRTWILDEAEQIWTGFATRFRALWATQATGDAFTAELFADAEGQAALAAAQDRYMARLFEDTLGFAGAKMIRRVLGLAHVEDLESIEDPDTRATAESKVLAIGRKLILTRTGITKFGEVLHLVEEIDS
jgi:5-methylthioribose kinase